MPQPPLHFIVPGSIDRKTGGYGYDRRIIGGLRESGRVVTLHELDGAFPVNDAAALAAAGMIDALPDGAVVVIDGLALPAFDARITKAASRLCFVPLVHHLLCDETSLDDEARQTLGRCERRCLQFAQRVIVTSLATAVSVAATGVPARNISVIVPGVDAPVVDAPALNARMAEPEAASSQDSGKAGLLLMSVGAVIARKGHRVLIRALAPHRDLDWRLKIFGSLDADPALSHDLRGLIAREGLSDRVELVGEVEDARLQAEYRRADIFTLASEYEGYGMAFAEALTHALPVVGSGDGAVGDTVPATAGLLVPVGDVDALSDALGRVLRDESLRQTLSKGAKDAGAQLPSWRVSAARFDHALERARAAFTATK